jgi:hypothetical protein
MKDTIVLRGVRVHNLKNINLDVPLYKFIVVSGVSGSGKSSLAFDTLYAEGQRRYIESLSAYARQFLERFAFRAAVIASFQADAVIFLMLARFLRPFSCYGGNLPLRSSGADGPLQGAVPSFRQVPD